MNLNLFKNGAWQGFGIGKEVEEYRDISEFITPYTYSGEDAVYEVSGKAYIYDRMFFMRTTFRLSSYLASVSDYMCERSLFVTKGLLSEKFGTQIPTLSFGIVTFGNYTYPTCFGTIYNVIPIFFTGKKLPEGTLCYLDLAMFFQ